jgi:hypothetical protein
MSKVYKHETDDETKKLPDYIENLTSTSRDMRSVDERNYSEEKLQDEATQEDNDEDWLEKNQSPLTGHISGTMEELERMQSSQMTTSDEVRECLKDSLDCYQSCTETTMRCLSIGDKHAESEHIRLLMDCARICSINADFMLRNSTYYPQTCGITADICDECGDNCDRFDDDFMKECASVCRRCAESCREMAR